MSDERQAFEQLHAIPSGAEWCEKRHIYIHKNYSGLVLHPINESWEAFCEGVMWQAARAGQAVSVPSILYDGYAVFQEVQHARNSKGLENIKDSALVSDVLDAVVKLIKQEQDQ